MNINYTDEFCCVTDDDEVARFKTFTRNTEIPNFFKHYNGRSETQLWTQAQYWKTNLK